jgi:hypothetical protein
VSIFSTRHQVNEVFTPRKTEVNKDIYVDRPELEKELKRAILGSKHAVLFGESGSGKSWLYKKVLSDLNAHVVIANSASSQRLGSLSAVIRAAAGLSEQRRLTGMSEEIDARAKVVVAESGLRSKREYEVEQEDPLVKAFSEIRKSAGRRLTVLVVDNLEIVLGSPALMTELGALVTLLDDDRFSEFDVKLLLVGVPSVLKEYFLRAQGAHSIANRLTEVCEVSSLSPDQVERLVERGFCDLLKVDIDSAGIYEWQSHIYRVTMGYAQAVQEYCEQLGYTVEDADWKGDAHQLVAADANWLKQGLSYASIHVATRMNERETKAGRRNQVLYALGLVTERAFTAAIVERIVRAEFPDSTADTTLAIGQILSELASGEHAIVKATANTAEYEFRDARFAMALRVLLEKDAVRDKVRRVNN